MRTFWCPRWENSGIPPDAGSLLRLPPLLDGPTGTVPGCRPVKTRGQSEQRPGVGRDTQLRAAPGSADRLAAASSPLLRERVPDEVFGVQDVHDAYAVAAGEQHHAPREPEGPWPTSSPARASCWLAAAEQQVVFDERRDHRLPARSAHHWPAGDRWWRLPPPNATSEWTGDERAH